MTTKGVSAGVAQRESGENREAEHRLPLFYKQVVPLNSHLHRNVVVDMEGDYGFASAANIIPVVLSEVASAQAHYPIVFTDGDQPVPVVLMGLPGKRNRFIDAKGHWRPGLYVPAYVRRYPFVLAKASETNDTLSLCFDPSADQVKIEKQAGNLFEGNEPSTITQGMLRLCEEYEASARRTNALLTDLVSLDLFSEAQAQIRKGQQELVSLHGFKIISEENLRKVPDSDLVRLAKSGALALIYAHLFSFRHLEVLIDEHDPDATSTAEGLDGLENNTETIQ